MYIFVVFALLTAGVTTRYLVLTDVQTTTFEQTTT